MCLLTYMPDTVTLSYERARRASISNPDGFGFAIHTGKSILTDHDMNFEKLWDRFDKVRKREPGHALFHWRIATHGEVDTSNCHPFFVGDKTDSVVAHNGILPIVVPYGDERSDTRLFAELVLPSCGGVPRLDDKEFFGELCEWARGNKLVILSADPEAKYDAYLVNETSGHWDTGVWWSNHSYESYALKPYSYMYSSPKPKDDFKYAYDDKYNDEDEVYSHEHTRMNKQDGSELRQLIAEELYADDETVGRIEIFTEFVSYDLAIVTCYDCSSTYIVDPLEPSPTHCSHCKSCLACSCSNNTCNCWDDYEHGQSFTPSFTQDDGIQQQLSYEGGFEW